MAPGPGRAREPRAKDQGSVAKEPGANGQMPGSRSRATANGQDCIREPRPWARARIEGKVQGQGQGRGQKPESRSRATANGQDRLREPRPMARPGTRPGSRARARGKSQGQWPGPGPGARVQGQDRLRRFQPTGGSVTRLTLHDCLRLGNPRTQYRIIAADELSKCTLLLLCSFVHFQFKSSQKADWTLRESPPKKVF
jgi:hypothetical protein